MKNYMALGLLWALFGCATTPPEPTAAKLPAMPIVNPMEADAAYQRQDWVTAEKLYLALVKTTPSDANAWFKLGNLYMHTQRSMEAQKAYREALNQNPQLAKASHNLGTLYLLEAQRSFEKVIEIVPKNDPLHAQTQTLLSQVTQINNPPPPVTVEVPNKKKPVRSKNSIRWN